MDALHLWKLQLEELLSEIAEQTNLEPGGLFVVGCSTSEVAGKKNWDVRSFGNRRNFI